MQYNAYSKDDCPSQTGQLQEFLSIIIICLLTNAYSDTKRKLSTKQFDDSDMQMYAQTFIQI